MRLLRCHIENFGKLKDDTIDFSSGLTVINEQNGWGKSTLAAFIKVMFYGFANEKKRGDELERERTRFKPWMGGVYGGEILFEAGGKRYLLNRTFGAKEAEDTLALYDADTNLRSEDFAKDGSHDIGEELFRINRESFQRTIYIAQNDCVTGTTDSINAKLGNLADHLDDINHYENVQDVLKDMKNKLTPARKTGELWKLKNEIGELKNELRKRDSVEQAIAELEARLNKCAEEKEAAGRELESLQEELLVLSRQRELLAKKAYCERILQADRLSGAEEKELAALREKFAAQVPDEEQIAQGKKLTARLDELQREAARYRFSAEEEREEARLENCFHGADVSEEEVDYYLKQWNMCSETRSGLGAKQATLRSLQAMERSAAARETARRKSRNGVLLILSAGLILAGLAICLLNLIAGMAFAVAGFGLLAAMLIAGLRGKMREAEPAAAEDSGAAELEEEIAGDIRRTEAAEEEIRSFLDGLRLADVWGDSVRDTLYALKTDIRALKRLQARRLDYQNMGFEQQIDALREEAETELGRYYPADEIRMRELRELYADLENGRNAYLRLTAKEEKTESARAEYDACVKECEAFFAACGRADLADSEEELRDPDELREQIQRVNERLEAAGESKNAYLTRLDDARREAEELEEKQERLEKLTEQYEAGSRFYQNLERTGEYLARAKESLSARYMGPIMTAFRANYEKLSRISGEDFRIDANIHITRREAGGQRDTRALSAGSQDLVGIALRMALIEAMYRKEQPFLIFDDPFVNLDDGKMEHAKQFLREIAERYQVIYFTCHESRNA